MSMKSCLYLFACYCACSGVYLCLSLVFLIAVCLSGCDDAFGLITCFDPVSMTSESAHHYQQRALHPDYCRSLMKLQFPFLSDVVSLRKVWVERPLLVIVTGPLVWTMSLDYTTLRVHTYI